MYNIYTSMWRGDVCGWNVFNEPLNARFAHSKSPFAFAVINPSKVLVAGPQLRLWKSSTCDAFIFRSRNVLHPQVSLVALSLLECLSAKNVGSSPDIDGGPVPFLALACDPHNGHFGLVAVCVCVTDEIESYPKSHNLIGPSMIYSDACLRHLQHVLSWRSGFFYNHFPLPFFSQTILFRSVATHVYTHLYEQTLGRKTMPNVALRVSRKTPVVIKTRIYFGQQKHEPSSKQLVAECRVETGTHFSAL